MNQRSLETERENLVYASLEIRMSRGSIKNSKWRTTFKIYDSSDATEKEIGSGKVLLHLNKSPWNKLTKQIDQKIPQKFKVKTTPYQVYVMTSTTERQIVKNDKQLGGNVTT